MKSSPAAIKVCPRPVTIVPAFVTSLPSKATKPPPSTTVAGLAVLICAPASTVTAPPASVKTGTRIGASQKFTGGTEFEVIPRSRNWMFEMSAVAAIRLRTLTCEAPPKMIPLRLMM
ncbi:hypothetical protein D3C87_1317910 [compost metagenome]